MSFLRYDSCVPGDQSCPEAALPRNSKSSEFPSKPFSISLPVHFLLGAFAALLFLATIEFAAEEMRAPPALHPAVWFQAGHDWVVFPFFRSLGRGWVSLCNVGGWLHWLCETLCRWAQQILEFLCRWLPLERFAAALGRVMHSVAATVLSPFQVFTGMVDALREVGEAFQSSTVLLLAGTGALTFVGGILYFQRRPSVA